MTSLEDLENLIKKMTVQIEDTVKEVGRISARVDVNDELRKAASSAVPGTPMQTGDGDMQQDGKKDESNKPVLTMKDFDIPQLTGEERAREEAYKVWAFKMVNYLESQNPKVSKLKSPLTMTVSKIWE